MDPSSPYAGRCGRMRTGKCKPRARTSDMALRVQCKHDVMDVIDERDAPAHHVSLWVIAAGAAAGALVGYALRTPRGQRVFEEVIVMLEDFASACARFSQ